MTSSKQFSSTSSSGLKGGNFTVSKDQFYISQYLYELTTNKKLALVAVYNFKLDILFLSLQKALLKLLTIKIIHSLCHNSLSTCAGMALWVPCLLHKCLAGS